MAPWRKTITLSQVTVTVIDLSRIHEKSLQQVRNLSEVFAFNAAPVAQLPPPPPPTTIGISGRPESDGLRYNKDPPEKPLLN